MIRMIGRARSAARGERGTTLVELLISMSILLLVLGVFLTALVVVQNAVARESDRSNSNDQARLAVEQLDREIRSGNVLYDPCPTTLPTPPTFSYDPTNQVYPCQALLIYTQTNATTLNPGNRCVQWLINNQEQLVSRDWSVDWRTDGIVSGWRVVASDIVNRPTPWTGLPTAGWTAAFELASGSSLYGGRLVIINILTQQSGFQGKPLSIYDSVEGRNTQYGYPANICQDIPPYPSSYPSS